MKTTVAQVDEAKLVDLMKLTGLKTRKAAIDFALTEAMRAASLRRVLGSSILLFRTRSLVDRKNSRN